MHRNSGSETVSVYIDDILFIGKDKLGIAVTKKFLKSQFFTKDLGGLNYFLSTEIT